MPGQSDKYWSSHERKVWVSALFVGSCLVYGSRQTMPISISFIANEQGWDKSQSGAVLSSFFWGYMTTQVLGGVISDHVGGDQVASIVAFCWGATLLTTEYIIKFGSDVDTTITMLIIQRIVFGAFQGAFYPPANALIAKKVPPSDRNFAISFFGSGSKAGSLVFGLIGSVLIEYIGWPSVFMLGGVLPIIWCLFIRLHLMKTNITHITDEVKASSTNHIPGIPWKKLLTKLPLWILLITHAAEGFAFFIFFSWMPTFFKEKFPEAKGWIYNVVPWFFAIPTALLVGKFADYLTKIGKSNTFIRKFFVATSFSTCILLNLIIMSTTSFKATLTAVTVLFCGMIVNFPGTHMNSLELAPAYSGTVFGMMNSCAAIAGMFGTYITGYILEQTDNWSIIFIMISVVYLCAMCLFVRFATGEPVISEPSRNIKLLTA